MSRDEEEHRLECMARALVNMTPADRRRWWDRNKKKPALREDMRRRVNRIRNEQKESTDVVTRATD